MVLAILPPAVTHAAEESFRTLARVLAAGVDVDFGEVYRVLAVAGRTESDLAREVERIANGSASPIAAAAGSGLKT